MTSAATKRVWHTTRDAGHGWHARFRVGRVGFGYHVYLHRYGPSNSPDRWVFHPFLTYDRRRA